ncbi:MULTISPECIES: hypothetical protein [unclassified Chryseobacterium]|uniref:hypothetical protein n=1 Tax=unclassified Chryseobacterium TaxID=2593645 RepID=UPI0030198B42
MGSINNALRSISGANDEEQRAKERLEILLMAAKAKLQAFRDEINENFTNPGQVDKKQIPGIRAMKYIEQYHVATQNSFSDQVKEHLNHAVDAFFSIGGNDNKENVKSGLKSLISGALDAFIGSTSAGESEQKTYIVIPENNAFVRVDIACWKYNFSQQKILNQHDSAVAYILCKSVIDHTKLSIDELIYLTTEILSTSVDEYNQKSITNKYADLSLTDCPTTNEDIMKQFQVMGYQSDIAKTLADTILGNTDKKISVQVKINDKGETENKDYQYSDIRENAKANSFISISENGKNFYLNNFKIGFGSYTKTIPSSITNVEAYIEEMIRVWKKLKVERKED